MKEILFNLMSRISGQAYSPAWEGKVFSIITAGLILAVFLIIFSALFYKYNWPDKNTRNLGIITAGILGIFIIGKFFISRFWAGYIPDRFLFYALPSPKIENPVWLILAVIVFLLFIKFREKLQSISTIRFLVLLSLFFFIFLAVVAGIREGKESIMDPMTRTQWEYTGNIDLVENTHNFLHDYIDLMPKMAVHATTHPPGYSLLVYYFYKLFNVSFFGISLLIIFIASISVIPLYYILKVFFTEKSARNALQIYMFMPGLVFMSATSLEAFFLTIVWVSIALLLIGWSRSWKLSALGGVAAGVSLFSNFLFLLLAPFFLGMLLHVWLKNEKKERAIIALRASISFLAFVLFFIFLWQWSGFSIIENFIAAKGANQEAVISNFQSIGIYFTFMIMNILAFGFSLGIVNLLLFIKHKKDIFKTNRPELWFGFAYVAFLLLLGIFQSELARLWMFMVPFFLFLLAEIIEKFTKRQFSAVLSLLFLQIVLIQALFYTYW